MGNGMNKIITGLYVGSVRDAKDQEQLRSNGITHIISIHDNPKRGVLEEVEYLCILASDKPHQNLSQFFPQCNDFIHGARVQGGSVLIHCLAGVSRSVTIAVAYLMSVTSLNWKDALKCVRAARAIANPNLGFQKQLQDFDGRRLREERRRLSLKFPRTLMFRPEDEREVRRMVVIYDDSVQSISTLPQVAEEMDEETASSLNIGSPVDPVRRCMSSPSTRTSVVSSSPCSSDTATTSSGPQSLATGPFDDLAPGRSPFVRRRTLPSPTKGVSGAKTV